jgi:hypothetical protein
MAARSGLVSTMSAAMILRRPVTAEDRRRAVEAAMRRHYAAGRVVRITEGMRRRICGSAEYRAGRRVER